MVENDSDLSGGKFDPGAQYGGFQPVHVLQEVEAGAAMDLWQVKGYMCLFPVVEAEELRGDLFVVEKGEFLLVAVGSLRNAGMFIEGVIIAEAILVQQLVNHFASFAAEGEVAGDDGT